MGGSQSMDEAASNPPALLLPRILEAEVVDWALVRECIRSCPDQCSMYCHGAEPSLLLRAIRRSAPVDVVELMLTHDEDAKDQISLTGETILHAACHDPDTVSLLIKRCPEQASLSDELGRLPLHMSTNSEAARQLIRCYPKALLCRSGPWGGIPLHHALKRQQLNPDLLRILSDREANLERCGGVFCRDKRGRTPLRLLLDSLEVEFVDELWDVLHEWICRLQNEGLDLHAFIEHGCAKSLKLMEKALKKFPDQILKRDKFGRTPLHVAAWNGQVDADALEALMRANPRAPRMTDNQGRLPIDIAAEGMDTMPHCLALLMKGEPRAVNTRDLMNGYYPFLTSALSPQENATNTYFLLRARPEVLSYYHTP